MIRIGVGRRQLGRPGLQLHIDSRGLATAGQTAHQALGLERGATVEGIRAAFLEKARALHPDLNGAEGAAAAFQRVQEAYEELRKQAEYAQLPEVDADGGLGVKRGAAAAGYTPVRPSWEAGLGAGGGGAVRDSGLSGSATMRRPADGAGSAGPQFVNIGDNLGQKDTWPAHHALYSDHNPDGLLIVHNDVIDRARTARPSFDRRHLMRRGR